MLTHFTDVMNLKESLYLRATRWSRVSRCASIVSNRDIKLMSARTRLIVKLPTVRDITTVCYTMNVHISNCLARTHKLSPHWVQTTPSRTWQPPTPSPPMTEWYISKLSQSKYKVKRGGGDWNICYFGWRQFRHVDKKRHCRQAESRGTGVTTLPGKHWK